MTPDEIIKRYATQILKCHISTHHCVLGYSESLDDGAKLCIVPFSYTICIVDNQEHITTLSADSRLTACEVLGNGDYSTAYPHKPSSRILLNKNLYYQFDSIYPPVVVPLDSSNSRYLFFKALLLTTRTQLSKRTKCDCLKNDDRLVEMCMKHIHLIYSVFRCKRVTTSDKSFKASNVLLSVTKRRIRIINSKTESVIDSFCISEIEHLVHSKDSFTVTLSDRMVSFFLSRSQMKKAMKAIATAYHS